MRSVERKARPGRVPPAEPGRRRGGLLLAAVAVVVLGGATAWFLLGDSPDESPEVAAPAAPAPPGLPRDLTPTEIADPDEARRVAEKLENRERYVAIRSAFQAKQGETPASRTRLEPALEALWPARPRTFGVACREAVCRIDLPAPLEAARSALAADPGVRAIADGVHIDPDGSDPAVYVLLPPVNAAPGSDVLAEVEREFLRSTEARECLSRVGAMGSVEYELRVDPSGFTYRTRTDLPREVQDCVEAVLGGIITSTQVPPDVKTASLNLSLRR